MKTYIRQKNTRWDVRAQRAFSLMELIVVIAVALILSSISLNTFFNVSETQALEKDVNYVISFIEKARLQTVNSKNNSAYGVQFASSSVTLYQGSTYTAGASTNTRFDFSPKVEMSALNLSQSKQGVSFELITGKSNATGTIQFRLKTKPSASTTIVLYKTGLVETQ